MTHVTQVQLPPASIRMFTQPKAYLEPISASKTVLEKHETRDLLPSISFLSHYLLPGAAPEWLWAEPRAAVAVGCGDRAEVNREQTLDGKFDVKDERRVGCSQSQDAQAT